MAVRTLPAADSNAAAARLPYARWSCRVNLRAAPSEPPAADFGAAAGAGGGTIPRRTPPLVAGAPEFQFSRYFTTVYDDPEHLKLAIQAAQAVLCNPTAVPLARASSFAPELVQLTAAPPEVTAAAEATAALSPMPDAPAPHDQQQEGQWEDEAHIGGDAGDRHGAGLAAAAAAASTATLPTNPAALAHALSAAVVAALDPAKAKAATAAASAAGAGRPGAVKPHEAFLLQHRRRHAHAHNHAHHHHHHHPANPQPSHPPPQRQPPPPHRQLPGVPPADLGATSPREARLREARHCDALLQRLGVFPDAWEAAASRVAVVLEVEVAADRDGTVPKMDVLEIIAAAAEPADPMAEQEDASAPPHRITLLAPAAAAAAIAGMGMGMGSMGAAASAAAAAGGASPPPAAERAQYDKEPLPRCCGHVEVLLLQLLHSVTARLAEELLAASGGSSSSSSSNSGSSTHTSTAAPPLAARPASPVSAQVQVPQPQPPGIDLRRQIAAAARELRARQADCLPCFMVGGQDVGALPELEAAAGLGRKGVRRMTLEDVQVLLARHYSYYGSSNSSSSSGSSGSSGGSSSSSCAGRSAAGGAGGRGAAAPQSALHRVLNECFDQERWCDALAAHADQVAGAVRQAAGRAVAAAVDGERYPETHQLVSACLAAHVDELAGAALRRRLHELLRVERVMVYTRGDGGALRRERKAFMGRVVDALPQGPGDEQVDEEAVVVVATCLAYFKVLHGGVQAAVPRAVAAHLLQPLAQPAKLQPQLWQRVLAADDFTWHKVSQELLLPAATPGGAGVHPAAAAAPEGARR
ncbi:hypothetical protein HXX76_005208 [Chlamydomonas incerta]|uniref:Uncharacterized protein n=1 Tax=Chlamydomonas incerta TaxID=51695 RepID=A0A835T743_CHLIN|nr:hypothetical protein HXX76_005208 [Chlamydomonas incerta]|eukprot:KAG2438661.1 hypothetical protein HXX76_005208 [Chlamydomonas incerta]